MRLPISNDRRVPNYRRQSGRPELTPRQRRRVRKKEGRIRRVGGSA